MDRRWVQWVLVVVWILNIILTIAGIYFLLNWNAFVWIIGSTSWAIICEMICVVCILYLGCLGFCVLGWERNMESTHIGNHKSSFTFALVFPAIISSLFFIIALLCIANLRISQEYVRVRAGLFFTNADKDHNHLLTDYEYQTYTFSQGQYENTTEVRAQLIHSFDDMDNDKNGELTASEFYEGVVRALAPARRRFTAVVFIISLVSLAFIGIYWRWHEKLKEDHLMNAPRDNDFLDA